MLWSSLIQCSSNYIILAINSDWGFAQLWLNALWLIVQKVASCDWLLLCRDIQMATFAFSKLKKDKKS